MCLLIAFVEHGEGNIERGTTGLDRDAGLIAGSGLTRIGKFETDCGWRPI